MFLKKTPAKKTLRPTKTADLHTAISTLPFAFVRSRDRARTGARFSGLRPRRRPRGTGRGAASGQLVHAGGCGGGSVFSRACVD